MTAAPTQRPAASTDVVLEATDVIAGYLPGIDILNGCSMTVK
jgi:branched-chain amino acid transport system ATP-binding protein